MGLGKVLGSVAGPVVGSAMNLLGGAISDSRSAKASQASWDANYNAQKEFAQNSIQWRVQDAKKAGINPYAVVGGQSVGYTPQDISRTQDFATGISRAGNILADTLGQLQLATAKEDLKSKKLDNDKKSVELVNEVMKKNMGQVPKTITNPVDGTLGAKLMTAPDGSQRIMPEQASLDDLSNMAHALDTMYDRTAVESLIKANKGGKGGLGILGTKYYPKNFKPNIYDSALQDAYETSKKAGVLGGILSIPYHVVTGFPKRTIKNLWNKFMKGGKK